MKTTKIIGNCFLVLTGFMAGFLIVEGALRLYNPFHFRVRGDRIVLPVNLEYRITNSNTEKLDKTIVHTKNSLGFRGPSPPENLHEYLSIISIGGSTTECFFLADNKEWTHVLSRHLEKAFKDVWVNNAGLDGQSTFGHLVLMKDYIASLKPTIVLFVVGINDVALDTSNFYDQKMMKKLAFSSLTGLIISIANHSELFTLLLNVYRYVKARNMGVTHGTAIDLRAEAKDLIQISPEEKTKILQHHKDHYVTPYHTRLRELVQFSRKLGIDPVLVTQPALYGYTNDDVTQVDLSSIKVNSVNGGISWEILELINNESRAVGQKEGVLVIDLAKELPKSSKYFYDLIHFSNEGAQLVASILFGYLCPYIAEKYPGRIIKDCSQVPAPL